MPQPQLWLRSLSHSSRFPSPVPPFSSISFSPAQFIAQPSPNKALASVKQGALHKKVMSAGSGDRRDSVLCASDRVRLCTHARMCECCVCVSLHQHTVFTGLWCDLTRAIRQSNSLPGDEWHHGISRGDSSRQARFWMAETANDCLQTAWGQDSVFYHTRLPTHCDMTE